MRYKDSVTLGTIAGLIATVPQIILDYISVQLHYSKWYAYQLSASIFLDKPETIKPMGLLLGGIIWSVWGAGLGILTVYFMSITGKDSWWLKGLTVSIVIQYIIVYGILYTLGAAKIVPFDIPTNMTVLAGNIVFGIVMPHLIIRWGDNILFKAKS